MASFSTLSKTYTKDKLSKCATTVLLVCCYLYRKRSNTINVNAEAEEQGRVCKLPSMTLVFLPRYREARKLPPSPRWSPSQGIPRKGQAPGWVTPWIASSVSSSNPLPDRSPPSSLSSFRPKRHGPCSLRYTVVATPQTRLV